MATTMGFQFQFINNGLGIESIIELKCFIWLLSVLYYYKYISLLKAKTICSASVSYLATVRFFSNQQNRKVAGYPNIKVASGARYSLGSMKWPKNSDTIPL